MALVGFLDGFLGEVIRNRFSSLLSQDKSEDLKSLILVFQSHQFGQIVSEPI